MHQLTMTRHVRKLTGQTPEDPRTPADKLRQKIWEMMPKQAGSDAVLKAEWKPIWKKVNEQKWSLEELERLRAIVRKKLKADAELAAAAPAASQQELF
jgi:hypothetical protein